MTTAADDRAVEEAFEALLAGRPVPEDEAGPTVGLVAFTDAVRASATAPGRPHAALAELLATGLTIDRSRPSPRTATQRRRRMFIPALIAKFLSAGAVAQAATGAGIVLVAFTGAGTAGALPDGVQHGFATVANEVGVTVDDPTAPAPAPEPASAPAPEPAPEPAPAPAPAPTGTDTTSAGGAEVTTDDETCPGDAPTFGACVSEKARNGGVSGADVSRWAQDRNESRKAGGTDDVTPEQPEVEAPEADDDGGSDDAADDSRTSTSGRQGNGASGNGGSGKGSRGDR